MGRQHPSADEEIKALSQRLRINYPNTQFYTSHCTGDLVFEVIFEEKKVRTIWDDEQEKWYFCVIDVVEVLIDSRDPSDYIKKMRKRDPELAKGWGQIVTPLSIQTAGGKQKMNFAEIKRNEPGIIPSSLL